MPFRQVNEAIRASRDRDVILEHCLGQRFLASGMSDRKITITGIAGNALGSYNDGCTITVMGNAQDATADTMNDGLIAVHGSCGDGAGYGMRGGRLFIKGDVGYRAGIHMKEYESKRPVLIVGGTAGSFLGEYQAGGIIAVLGLRRRKESPLTGYFCAAGMYGGKLFLRSPHPPKGLPERLICRRAGPADLEQLLQELEEFCVLFQEDLTEILSTPFYLVEPDSKNSYKQLYTHR